MEQSEKTTIKESKISSPDVRTRRADKPRTPWQRLVLSSIGLIIITGIWQWATWHLYSLPEHAITAFTSITTNAFYVIAAIVIFMVTGKLIYDWKNQTVSSVIEQASHLTEHKKEDITKNIKIEEYIKEEGINAPEKKPFSGWATEE